MQKLKPRNTKTNYRKSENERCKVQNYHFSAISWRKHEQTRFRGITSCIRKRYHENPLAETCVSLRKHTEKWSGSVVSAATET